MWYLYFNNRFSVQLLVTSLQTVDSTSSCLAGRGVKSKKYFSFFLSFILNTRIGISYLFFFFFKYIIFWKLCLFTYYSKRNLFQRIKKSTLSGFKVITYQVSRLLPIKSWLCNFRYISEYISCFTRFL